MTVDKERHDADLTKIWRLCKNLTVVPLEAESAVVGKLAGLDNFHADIYQPVFDNLTNFFWSSGIVSYSRTTLLLWKKNLFSVNFQFFQNFTNFEDQLAASRQPFTRRQRKKNYSLNLLNKIKTIAYCTIV